MNLWYKYIKYFFIFIFFLSLYNNKDYCEKIDILWERLRCYSILYNKDFSSKFNNVIYLIKLLDTKYLYLY